MGEDLDWADLVEQATRWDALERAEREALLETKPGQPMPASVLFRWPQFHAFHKWVRALQRVDPLKGEAQRAVRAYVLEHLSPEQRQGLVGRAYVHDPAGALGERVRFVAYARGFLRAKKPLEWLRERGGVSRWSQVRMPGEVEPVACEVAGVIEALAGAGRALRLEELARETPSIPRERLAAAVRAALRCLLVFARLDRDLRPTLFVWPPVAERLRRTAAPAPEPVRPSETFCLAYRFEDLTHVLIRAAEPLRLKSNGRELFAAVERGLEAGLQPFPDWIAGPATLVDPHPTARLRLALRLGQALGFLAACRLDGGEHGLVVTAAGWKWLERGESERLRCLLDPRRPAILDPDAPDDPDLDELRVLDLEAEDDLGRVLRGFAGLQERVGEGPAFDWAARGQVAREAVAAFGALKPGTTVALDAFLRFQATAAEPWLALVAQDHGRSAYSWMNHEEEELEERWLSALLVVLSEHLLPFGGARLGHQSGGGWTIELTSVGRYLLGLSEEFERAAVPAGVRPAIVQPDFEIVFVAPSPAHEAAIGRFAERVGRGVGALFRITRDSVQASAQKGMDAESALEALRQASARELPSNVVHELRGWFAACRRLQLEPVHLIRCPDAATAARVLAAAGRGKLESLSDTLLALTDRTQRSAVVRACLKAGLFLLAAQEPDAGRRDRARR